MRRIITTCIAAVMLVMLMCLPAVCEEMPLSVDEVSAWLAQLLQESRENPEAAAFEDENGVCVQMNDVRLYIGADTLAGATTAYAALLTASSSHDHDPHFCPRGLMVTNSADVLLSAYPRDNMNLSGDYYSAALYAYDHELGTLQRDGQHVTQATHAAWQDGLCARAEYTLSGGYITSVYISLTPDATQGEAEIESVHELMERDEYRAYPVSDTGADVLPLQPEDMRVSGLLFSDAQADNYAALLGAPVTDIWLADTNGETLRVTSWPGAELVARYTENRALIAVSSLTIKTGELEGPRGTRVGDSMETVRGRFRFGEGATTGSEETLYQSAAGTGTADYALRTLRYECANGPAAYTMLASFDSNGLTALLLFATID